MDYEGLKYIKGSKIVFFVLHRNYQKSRTYAFRGNNS